MEQLAQYFLKNFFLLCLSFGVIFMVLRGYRNRRGIVLMPILIVSSAVLLSILYAVEIACLDYPNLRFLATLCFALGFMIRPLVLYFFMRIQIDNRIVMNIALGLVIVNAILYTSCLFINVPELSHLIYWYQEKDGVLVHQRGTLYFANYFITGAMMAYLIFISLASLKGPRRYDALASLICVAFIGLAVVLETLLVADSLLNTTIAISVLFYVVHIYQQASRRDGLTNLLDRKTYYSDSRKLEAKIRGVVLVDMNSLKLINDTQGHAEGDKAIISIARALEKSILRRSAFAYRMGGDEFLVVSYSSRDHSLEDIISIIRSEMSKTPYTLSIGYAYKESPETGIAETVKAAEEMMYHEKALYYQTTGLERRHRAN